MPGEPDCHPERSLPPIYQLTLLRPRTRTSSATPATTSAPRCPRPRSPRRRRWSSPAGSSVLTPRPTRSSARLEQTATTLGGAKPNPDYGYGLLNAGAATAPIAAAVDRRT